VDTRTTLLLGTTRFVVVVVLSRTTRTRCRFLGTCVGRSRTHRRGPVEFVSCTLLEDRHRNRTKASLGGRLARTWMFCTAAAASATASSGGFFPKWVLGSRGCRVAVGGGCGGCGGGGNGVPVGSRWHGLVFTLVVVHGVRTRVCVCACKSGVVRVSAREFKTHGATLLNPPSQTPGCG